MARQIFRATNRQSEPLALLFQPQRFCRGRSSPQSYSGKIRTPPCERRVRSSNLARCLHRLRNHKSGRRLRGVTFGVPRFTPEGNVHDGCIGRRVRNSPIEILAFRMQPGANPHSECRATVHRQPHFHLACPQVYVGKRRSPLNPDFLPRVENLPHARRNQRGRICSARA